MGALLYDSSMIEPNYHIQRDTSFADLDVGDRPAARDNEAGEQDEHNE